MNSVDYLRVNENTNWNTLAFVSKDLTVLENDNCSVVFGVSVWVVNVVASGEVVVHDLVVLDFKSSRGNSRANSQKVLHGTNIVRALRVNHKLCLEVTVDSVCLWSRSREVHEEVVEASARVNSSQVSNRLIVEVSNTQGIVLSDRSQGSSEDGENGSGPHELYVCLVVLVG